MRKTDLRGLSGHKRVSLCRHDVDKLQVSNVPARNRSTTGVQVSPALLACVNYAERGKAISVPCAIHGKLTARRAGTAVVLRSRKKQMPPCNEADRVCNMAQLKTGNLRLHEK
jgi:hypothetical protein